MALVNYSDSEGSDSEETQTAPASTKKTAKLSNFQKVVDTKEPRKIKVDLPSVKPERNLEDEQQPPAKRARTNGAFSGFNSLLPAPKRAASSAPKAGVSLKTSSEAAFSRTAPVTTYDDHHGVGEDDEAEVKLAPVVAEEPKMVGKATKFKPLSVANKKKPLKKPKPPVENKSMVLNGNDMQHSVSQDREAVSQNLETPVAPPPKPKRSLFSMPEAGEDETSVANTATYETLVTEQSKPEEASEQTQYPNTTQPAPSIDPNSLQSLASDLNLTPAQRRHLFGRSGKDGDVKIAYFNMDSEYAANEHLRQTTDASLETKAVKAIAPGKHSLQQLVNNATSQRDAMEDKFAAGKSARSGAGAGYGWK